MKIILAGAGGAVGLPLTQALVRSGHEVVALTRTEHAHQSLAAAGAEPVAVDVLDNDALVSALSNRRADAVINQLTDLKKPPMTHRGMAGTNRLREAGTRNLVGLAEKVGATRFVTQSMLFGYGYGDAKGKVYTESDVFAPAGQGKFERALAGMRINERLVLGSTDFAGVALRYGLFYGVGAGDDQMVTALRKRQLPVSKNAGPLSWIYIDDAVSATVAALERGESGRAYNIVDDQPVSWTQFMTELAGAIGAKPPRTLPAWVQGLLPYARTLLRGGIVASNQLAKTHLGWAPAVASYHQGVALIAEHHRSAAQRPAAA